ncbi:DUF6626 family protein [uncultured Aliiroseovarius sp.]|uniref:DUF6626 family protein n=1 Tax=uncultured Aliiroseovarius sp. TaxID=1658783 RepID=UPI00342DC75E
MEQIYIDLRKENLVDTAEDFSRKWCRRSRSWYAVQKNSGSDFSVQAAIACLQHTQIQIALAHLRKKTLGTAVDLEIEILRNVRSSLEAYLHCEHNILSVAPANGLSPNA